MGPPLYVQSVLDHNIVMQHMTVCATMHLWLCMHAHVFVCVCVCVCARARVCKYILFPSSLWAILNTVMDWDVGVLRVWQWFSLATVQLL